MRTPHLGGNKYYKLLGYLNRARSHGISHLITMAGAYSNHLRAFAALTRREGLQATAFIRGEELSDPDRRSAEIRFAMAAGVQCKFIGRSLYRALRETGGDAERAALFPDMSFSDAVFIPEGGFGLEGIEGVRLWAQAAAGFETIFLPCATGTTAVGFLAATKAPTRIRAVAVLRNGDAVERAINLWAPADTGRFDLITDYAARFGKDDAALRLAAADFQGLWGIPIDTTYMAKAALALRDAAERQTLPGRTLLVYTYNE